MSVLFGDSSFRAANQYTTRTYPEIAKSRSWKWKRLRHIRRGKTIRKFPRWFCESKYIYLSLISNYLIIYVCVRVSVCVSVYVCVPVSVCVCVQADHYLNIYNSICAFINPLFESVRIYLSIHLFFHSIVLSILLFISVRFYLSIYLNLRMI